MTVSRLPVGNTRDRLLLAAAELMHASGDRTVSTRAICDRAGVQAPTLYHHFGSKQGLVDAVIEHGFTQYVASGDADESGDPLAALRDGWDRHVEFGLEHPTFYALLYGNVAPGRPCAITAPAVERLTELCRRAARDGRLRVPPDAAAAHLHAANVGVTLALIAQPEGERDTSLSRGMRDTTIAAVTAPADGASPNTLAAAAITLEAALDDDSGDLTVGERALLRELLARLSR